MSIVFNCPRCSKEMRVPDSAAGRSGTCNKCNQRLTVPQQMAVVSQPVAVPAVVSDEPDFLSQLTTQRDSSPVHITVERAPEKPSNSMGIAALVLGIVAFPLSWIPLVSIVSVPLSGLGLLLGFVALMLGIFRRGAGVGFGIAGVAICGLSLMLTIGSNAAVVSGANAIAESSRKDNERRNKTASDPDAKRAPNKAEPKTVAYGKMAVMDGVAVTLTAVVIGKARLEDGLTQADESDRFLMVSVLAKNTTENKKLTYKVPNRFDFNAEGESLSDNFDNTYARIRFEKFAGKQTRNTSFNPGQQITDEFIFEQPIKTAETLEFTLPAARFGIDGQFRFSIPMDKVNRVD